MPLIAPWTPGRLLILVANLFIAVGAFVADWNETHVKNPRWPPHARFHNGQTMSFSLLLSALASYLLLRDKGRTHRTSRVLEDAHLAAVVGSLYSIAGLSAILYPGADWKDPEFDGPRGIQIVIFGGQLAVNWLGYALERNRLSHLKLA